jgi:omega-6 fatty acid desaturase (delta-12 desaturase)
LKSAGAATRPCAARDWIPTLNQYRAPDHFRSFTEALITVTPFALLWAAAWASLQWSLLLSLAIAVVAAGFLVRLFMIQHDCGHGSFFPPEICERLGRSRHKRVHFHTLR